MSDESGKWVTSDDPHAVEGLIRGFQEVPNLGVLLHPRENSRLICLDIDDFNEKVRQVLMAMEVSRTERIWRQKTGKDGMHGLYPWQGDPLPRVIKAGRLPVDLLTNGFAVVSPSNTYLEPGGGGLYRWVPGHAPSDISIFDLDPPPELLINWWREQATGSRQTDQALEGSWRGQAWHLLRQPISAGTRNQSLTRLAGYLRHYHPFDTTLALLQAVNIGKCKPPLEQREVERIAHSVYRYSQCGVNGHPRAVVPSFVRQDAS